MGKGLATRQAVVERAAELARTVGLEGLTIGMLSEDLHLSKSGLFAHFGSKERLQLAVISEARRQFVDAVIAPALLHDRGLPRLRAMFEGWMEWGKQPGGCFFVAAAAELDDRDGQARTAAATAQRDWLDTLAHTFHLAIDEGHLRRGSDERQLAFELQGIMLAFHFAGRFVRDPHAEARARNAFDSLIAHHRP